MEMIGVVVWDGRRNGPGSAYLVALPEPPRRQPGKVLDFRSLTDQILDALGRRPRTARGLANDLGRSIHDISGTLYSLRQRGLVCRQDGKPVDPRVGFGRKSEHVYRLVEGA